MVRLLQRPYSSLMALAIDEVLRARSLAANGLGRAIRLAADASLSEVGEAVGVSGPTISRWENGKRRPRGDRAVRYAQVLDQLQQHAAQGSQ